MPGGVGTIWPFIAGRFVELPYTLPQDHTLFIVLQEGDGEIWQKKLDYIRQMHGMSLVITHPDYLDVPQRLDAYRRLLVAAQAANACWHALPKDVAAWWRERDVLRIRHDDNNDSAIVGRVADRAKLASIRVVSGPDGSGQNPSSDLPPQSIFKWQTLSAGTLTDCEVRQ
jgi:hypothetical protein